VRLQKGMFLDAQESGTGAGEKYTFVPYNYGPMSAQIYSDLEQLVAEGLVAEKPVEGQSWARYAPTEKGLEAGRKLLAQEASGEVAKDLHRIKKEVASKTFKALLEDVYERYPAYASKSVFRRDE
jgi:uncharacterized protein YwgA